MQEYYQRRKAFWLGLTLAGLVALLMVQTKFPGATPINSLTAASPFALAGGCFAFWIWPTAQRKLGTQSQSQPPSPTSPGNPMLRQPGYGCGLLVGMFLLSLGGCTGIGMEGIGNSQAYVPGAIPAMYFSLFILAAIYKSWVRWMEVDVSSLKLYQHDVLFGLKVTKPPREAIQYLAVCLNSGSNYATYGFTGRGQYMSLGPAVPDYRLARQEGQKLADQLMIPLLDVNSNAHPDRIHSQLRSGTVPQVQDDWLPTTFPESLQTHRNPLPPID